ncbi:MAG: AMP-binding protein, partial [Ardenticatenales bacterium]
MNPPKGTVRFAGRDLAAADVAVRSAALASALAAEGVRPGDRVVSLLRNSTAPVVLVHACRLLDAVLVPLNPRWSAAELAEPAARTAPCAAVVDGVADGDADRAAAGVVAGAAGGRVVRLDGWGDVLADRPRRVVEREAAQGGAAQGVPPVGDAPSAADFAPADIGASSAPWPPPVEPDRPQAVIFTSGTTGTPKGAVLTWGNHHANFLGSRARLGHGADDVWLVALPLHHVGGLAIVLRAAWDGSAMIVLPRFAADDVARAIGEDGVTIVSLVPSTLRAVLDAWRERFGARRAPHALRAILLGGGPLAAAPVAEAIALGFPLAITYGLTEAASQVATTAPGWTSDASAGAPPLDGVLVRIDRVDPGAGVREVARAGDDAAGEILVAGPTIFAGYWEDPAATTRAIDGGWLRTGDLGRLDAAGRLRVVGRRDARIVTGGENVDPAEVEAVLDGHPGIGASCVVGVPDATWGQIVVAVVEPARGAEAGGTEATSPGSAPTDEAPASPDAAALRVWLDGRLAGYKRPRRVVVVAALPRTAAGKLRRGEVERLAAGDVDAA